MELKFLFDIKDLLTGWGLPEKYVIYVNTVFGIALFIILAYLSDIISKRIILRSITRIIRRTKSTCDDILLEKKLFTRLSHLAPAIILFYSARYVLSDYQNISVLFQGATKIFIILLILLVIDSLINYILDIYQTLPVSKNRPIKGYVQVIKILVYFIAGLLIIFLG